MAGVTTDLRSKRAGGARSAGEQAGGPGLEARDDTFVLEAARRSGVPVVVTPGGGYARPLEVTVRAHIGTHRAARRVWG
ncbi:MAG TPA: hypothetical protein VMT11_21150 [Myxococcaceae bacterium]|nr:hypothetical protein [Myxococcaceae bacterium]